VAERLCIFPQETRDANDFTDRKAPDGAFPFTLEGETDVT